MKVIFVAIILFGFDALSSQHQLELNLSSRQLESILSQSALTKPMGIAQPKFSSRELDRVIEVGKRNLDWLDHINSHRNEPLRFTKPGTLRSIPITDPKKYSDQIVVREFQDLTPLLLQEMKEVLIDGQPFRDEPPQDLENYLLLGRKVDRLYQTALRWILLSPYLDWYAYVRRRDIRGIYFLNKESELDRNLANWSTLSEERKAQLAQWLMMTCYNTVQNDESCRAEFERSKHAQKLNDYFNKYKASAEAVLSSFFRLNDLRSDVSWTGSFMKLNLLPVAGQDRSDFVKFNIEDEFKWKDWSLKLDYLNDANVEVIFEPGITPHVNMLGGNLLFMDANVPLTEWDNQWTIRHEFGHVLGLPDCYVEFYDPNEKVMINYQIDVDDLMCSRAGKMNERIFLELKRAYQRDSLRSL